MVGSPIPQAEQLSARCFSSASIEMSQVHLRPDAARRGPTRLRPQDVASPTRGPTLELLRSHVRPCRFDTCFSAARAKPDAARRAAPTPPTANPPPTPSHVRHSSTGARRTRRVAASRAKSARHFRRPSPLRRRRTSDMGRRGRHVRRVGPTLPTAGPRPTPSHVRHGPTRTPRPTCRPRHLRQPGDAPRRRTSDMGRRDRHVRLVVRFLRQVLQRVRRDGLRRVRHSATGFEWTRRRRRDQGALPPPAPSSPPSSPARVLALLRHRACRHRTDCTACHAQAQA